MALNCHPDRYLQPLGTHVGGARHSRRGILIPMGRIDDDEIIGEKGESIGPSRAGLSLWGRAARLTVAFSANVGIEVNDDETT